MIRTLVVTVARDDEAGVWVATSDDVPGLVSEAASYEDLRARVLAVAPELLRDNVHLVGPLDGAIHLRFEDVAALDRSAA